MPARKSKTVLLPWFIPWGSLNAKPVCPPVFGWDHYWPATNIRPDKATHPTRASECLHVQFDWLNLFSLPLTACNFRHWNGGLYWRIISQSSPPALGQACGCRYVWRNNYANHFFFFFTKVSDKQPNNLATTTTFKAFATNRLTNAVVSEISTHAGKSVLNWALLPES